PCRSRSRRVGTAYRHDEPEEGMRPASSPAAAVCRGEPGSLCALLRIGGSFKGALARSAESSSIKFNRPRWVASHLEHAPLRLSWVHQVYPIFRGTLSLKHGGWDVSW